MSILDGSPYSFADPGAVEKIARREDRVRGRLQAAKRQLVSSMADLSLATVQQETREIYESNKIEGLGPDLARTGELLREYRDLDLQDPILQEMISSSVKLDQGLVDVLGLAAARRMATSLVTNDNAIMSAVDLRGLHAQICVGEWFAGCYKVFPNAIEGSDLATSSPADTPIHMNELVDWMRVTRNESGTIRAAVTHGWLAHIHPFPDGNGRLSRVLMNSDLLRAGLPPVIVRHQTDRSRYIAALAESDAGGDLFPLVAVMLEAQLRYVREIGKPGFLRRLIREEIERATSTAYESWTRAIYEFLDVLESELAVRHSWLRRLDRLTISAFNLLIEQDSAGATWAAWVGAGQKRLLLWFGFSTAVINGSVEGTIRYPSVIFSARSGEGSVHPYRRAIGRETGGIQEILIVPGLPDRVYLRTIRGNVRVGSLRDSAEEIAERLAEGLRNIM